MCLFVVCQCVFVCVSVAVGDIFVSRCDNSFPWQPLPRHTQTSSFVCVCGYTQTYTAKTGIKFSRLKDISFFFLLWGGLFDQPESALDYLSLSQMISLDLINCIAHLLNWNQGHFSSISFAGFYFNIGFKFCFSFSLFYPVLAFKKKGRCPQKLQ